MRKQLTILSSVLGLAGTLHAGAAIDGVLDAEYGPAIAVQTIQTGFGDNMSEWNAVYAFVDGGRLNVMITGNLEANFNKLDIFFDSKDGGENVMSGLPEYDFFAAPDWISGNLFGMTFDDGFEADYHMYARAGFENFEVDFIDRLGGSGAPVNGNAGSSPYGGAIGDATGGSVDPGNLAMGTTVGNALGEAIIYAMNNANTAGIGGATGERADQAAAIAVTTGFEFSIALDDLGVDGDEIRIAIMQNNGDHNYLANQNFFGLPDLTGNLGGDGFGGFTGDLSGIDFNDYEGPQFITVSVGGGNDCPADLDGNNDVGFSDLVELLANWGPCVGCPADLDGNDDVGFSDLVELLANWGACP